MGDQTILELLPSQGSECSVRGHRYRFASKRGARITFTMAANYCKFGYIDWIQVA